MQANKMLVILSPGFAADEADSTCLPAHQSFVKALKRNYPDVNFVILAFQYPFRKSCYQWFGNEVISFNGGNNPAKVKMLLLWVQVWVKMQALKRRNKVIGLLSFWCTDCALIGKYWGKMNRIPHYSWVTGQDAKKQNSFIRVIRPKTNELVAMSDFLAAQFYINHSIRIEHVIPNGIDISLFGKYDMEKHIDIMGAGSLISLKQYDIFIEVCAELIHHFKQLNIILCGAGPEENKLQEMIKESALDDAMILTGEKQHTDILYLMQAARIFLHTSSYEGFSTVCLEALYAGCQVISFIQPMKSDILHWHIVKTKEEMIAKAIELLQNQNTSYTSVLPYAMDESAIQFMKLFGC